MTKFFNIILIVCFICLSAIIYIKLISNLSDLKEQFNVIEKYNVELINEINVLEKQINILGKQINILEKQIDNIHIELKSTFDIVRVSWYNPEDIQQTDSTPNICAWGYIVKPSDRIIAVSRDWLKDGILKRGDEVIIGKYGKFIVKDKMNKKYRRSIDIAITCPDFPNLETLEVRKIKAKENGVDENCILIVSCEKQIESPFSF